MFNIFGEKPDNDKLVLNMREYFVHTAYCVISLRDYIGFSQCRLRICLQLSVWR